MISFITAVNKKQLPIGTSSVELQTGWVWQITCSYMYMWTVSHGDKGERDDRVGEIGDKEEREGRVGERTKRQTSYILGRASCIRCCHLLDSFKVGCFVVICRECRLLVDL